MRQSDCKIGGLYRIMPSPGFPNHGVLISAKSSGHELARPHGSCIVYPNEIILLIAIQKDYDDSSAYGMIALLGDKLLFVRSEWIEEVEEG